MTPATQIDVKTRPTDSELNAGWRFVVQYERPLLAATARYAGRYNLDPVDLAQDARMNIAVKHRNFDPSRSSAVTFVYLSVRWTASKMDEKRRRRRRHVIEVPAVERNHDGEETVMQFVELRETPDAMEARVEAARAFSTASGDDRKLLSMMLKGYDVTEMAVHMGLSSGQGVRNRVNRLAQRYAEGGHECLKT